MGILSPVGDKPRPRSVRRRRQRNVLYTALLVLFTGVLAYYRGYSPLQLDLNWAPKRTSSPKTTTTTTTTTTFAPDNVLCLSLPKEPDVFVAVKSGSHEARTRIPSFLNQTLRCAPRFEFYSDVDDQVDGYDVYDVLKGYPESVSRKYQEFETYRGLQAHASSGNYTEVLKNPNHGKKEDGPGWRLDKWKFLPMVERALMQDADWYFFIETDTHVVWSNLLFWLSVLDHTKPQFIGAPTWIGKHLLAHGGSGFLLSNAAAMQLREAFRQDPTKFANITSKHCCGDSALAYVMEDLKIPLKKAWPMLQQERISTIEYSERDLCHPVVTHHHVTLEDISIMWNYEQEWQHDPQRSARPITHSDVFYHFAAPTILAGVPKRDWDNICGDKIIKGPAPPAKDYSACEAACLESEKCVQFNWKPDVCNLGHRIKLGNPVERAADGAATGIVSGWMYERISARFKKMEGCDPKWIV